MSETLEKLRREFDVLLDTQLDMLTNPEIIQRGLELEKKFAERT